MLKILNRYLTRRKYATTTNTIFPVRPELDEDYLLDPKYSKEIGTNISRRKGVGNIDLVHDLKQKLNSLDSTTEAYSSLKEQLWNEMRKIPNRTHPQVQKYGDEPHIIKVIGEKRSFDFKPREFHEITKRLNMVRTDQLGNVAGSKSYYVLGELAELEHALIQFTLRSLMKRNFQLMSVPDVLHKSIIEGCGMATTGQRTQVYSLDPEQLGPDLCLSGTSEMALAGFLANKTIPEAQLPLKLTTVSRCYRAETSSIAEERGIYRVHEFTKVEMFAASTPDQSEQLLEEFRAIEEENFSLLGLHLRTLDMPPHELGAPAFRKYDIEAWLPGREMYGEISSCSNCTDYQSRRLGIKYESDGHTYHLHTINGTACAIPRMLIALIETYQNDNGTIDIPEALQVYMRGKTKMSRQKKIPELQLVKNKRK